MACAPAFAAIPAKTALTEIESDLARFSAKKEIRFDRLAEHWESKYGMGAIPHLVAIAKNPKKKDSERFVALLVTARLEPANASAIVRPFFKDSSWMMRSAALQASARLDDRSAAPEIIRLLRDPALVIRSEAAQTIGTMKLTQAEDALLEALFDGRNYRPSGFQKGRADWVPERALEALRRIRAKSAAPRLLTLMNGAHDPKLRAHALYTIEQLEGKKLVASTSFKERAAAWNKHYSSSLFNSQAAARRLNAGRNIASSQGSSASGMKPPASPSKGGGKSAGGASPTGPSSSGGP